MRRISSGCCGIGHRRVHQRRLEGADIALGIARAAVPGGRHDALVVVDLAVLDLDPVRQRAARRLGEADALGLLRPGSPAPTCSTLAVEVSPALMLAISLSWKCRILYAGPLAFEPARRRAAERREQRRHRQRRGLQQLVDRLLELRLALRVADDLARQRADLHGVALPARRLDPGIFAALVELLDIGLACPWRSGPSS